MNKLRPFMPPQAAHPGAQPAPAPRFPGAATGTSTPAAAARPYTARPLDNRAPGVDLQALLDAAQRQVDTLQSQSAAQSATFEQERSKFHGAVEVLEQSRARACRVLAKDAVALGVEIAHALAGRAFELDHTRLISLLEAALLEFSAEHPVRVRVAASEVPHIKAHLSDQEASFVHVDADPAMSPGDLSVEAEQLVVDARLTERVAMLRDELASAVRSDEALEDGPSDAPEAAEATE